MYIYLDSINFFRTYQGTGGRSEMIEYAFQKIKESPLYGFGYGSTTSILKSGGFGNASTHNSLADYMLRFGIPCLIIYCIIIFEAYVMGASKKKKVYINLMTIFLFLNMNTILYSFGGVGFPSIMFTMFLGISCCGGCDERK